MVLEWREHPEAREELVQIHEHYRSLEGGQFDIELVDEVDKASELIQRWPNSPPRFPLAMDVPVVRHWRLGKFPYRLVYSVGSSEIFVLVYAHRKRRPGYWLHRLDDHLG